MTSYLVLLLFVVSSSGTPAVESIVSKKPSTLEECQQAGQHFVDVLKKDPELNPQAVSYACIKFPLATGGQST